MICILTRYPDCTMDITTKDGRVFKLLQSSAPAITSKTTIPSSKISVQIPASTSPVKPSQQCIWCDNFGHHYSACQEFHQALLYGHIYLSETHRILSTQSGRELPLAIGRGGMKAYL